MANYYDAARKKWEEEERDRELARQIEAAARQRNAERTMQEAEEAIHRQAASYDLYKKYKDDADQSMLSYQSNQAGQPGYEPMTVDRWNQHLQDVRKQQAEQNRVDMSGSRADIYRQAEDYSPSAVHGPGNRSMTEQLEYSSDYLNRYSQQDNDLIETYLSKKDEAEIKGSQNGERNSMMNQHRRDEAFAASQEAAEAKEQWLKQTGKTEKDFEDAVSNARYLYDYNKQRQETEQIRANIHTGNAGRDALNAAAYTGTSWLTSVGRGYGAIAETIQGTRDPYAPINTYSNRFGGVNFSNAVQGEVANRLSENGDPNKFDRWDFAAKAYQIGNSIGESATSMALGGMIGVSIGGPLGQTIANIATLPSFGTSAYASTLQQAQERGLDKTQAVMTATAAGAFEMLTELVSLDHFWDIAKAKGSKAARNAVIDVLAQAGIEGSEEGASEILNLIADNIINGDQSEFNQNVQNYVSQGMSEKDAKIQASKDWGLQFGEAVLGGTISGGFMGSFGSAIGTVRDTRAAREMLQYDDYAGIAEAMDTDEANYDTSDDLQKNALQAAKDAKSLAEDLAAKKENGEKVTSAEKRKLYQLVRDTTEMSSEASEPSIEVPEHERVESIPEEYMQPSNMTGGEMVERMTAAKTADELVDVYREAQRSSDAGAQAFVEQAYKQYKGRMINAGATQAEFDQAEGRLTSREAFMAGAQGVPESNISLTDKTREDYLKGAQQLQETKAKAAVKSSEDIKGITLTGTGDTATITKDGVSIKASEYENANPAVNNLVSKALTQTTQRAAQAYLDNYVEGAPITSYTRAFNTFHDAGALGVQSFDDVLKKNRYMQSMIPKETLQRIYDTGRADLDEMDSKAKGTIVRKGEGEVKDMRTDKSTKAAFEPILEAFAKRTGTTIVLKDDLASNINGFFERSTGEIVLNTKSNRAFGTLIHEGFGEMLEAWNPEAMKDVQDAILSYAVDTMGEERLNAIGRNYQRAYIEQQGRTALRSAMNEYVNDAIAGVFSTETGIQDFAEWLSKNRTSEQKQTILQKIADWISKLVDGLKNMLGNSRLNEAQRMTAQMAEEQAEAIRTKILDAMDVAIRNRDAAEIGGEGSSRKAMQINAEESVYSPDVDNAGKKAFSIETYEQGGRAYLENWLKDSGLTEQDQKDILDQLDMGYQLAKDMAGNKDLTSFARWSRTALVRNEQGVPMLQILNNDGRPIQSVVVNNGEYPLNIDFTQVCKKRITLNTVLNTLIEDYGLNLPTLTESDILKVTSLIKNHGFEVACGLCFVDAKRYRVGKWSSSFADGVYSANTGKKTKRGWNDLVRSMLKPGVGASYFNFASESPAVEGRTLSDLDDSEINFKELDRVIGKFAQYDADGNLTGIGRSKDGKNPTELVRMAYLLRTSPEARHFLSKNDLVASEGLDAMRQQNQDLYRLVNAHWGAGKPKLPHGFTAYGNEILRSEQWGKANNFTPEAAYAVGGVRVQSFSDYVANMFFDYMQMFADMAARKLPSHAYTKELNYVRLFGMTGQKINMSVIPKAAELTEEQQERYRGLSRKGKKALLEDEEFREIAENAGLAKDENGNYTRYIFEDESFDFDEALKIQADPRYNKNCGIIAVGVSDNHIWKMLDDDNIPMIIPYHASGVAQQVAKARNIWLYKDYTNQQTTRDKNGRKVSKDFDWYADLAKTNDPRTTANNYKAWCAERNYTPVFDTFKDHDNYYKLLIDFRVYDYNGVEAGRTQTYQPQGAVSMTFPEDFSDIVLESLKAQQETEQDLENNLTDEQGTLLSDVREALGLQEKQTAAREMSEQEAEETAAVMNKGADVAYSVQVTDRETLDFLEGQEYITTYRTFQKIGDGYYAPMNAMDNGKLGYKSMLGVWEQATEDPSKVKDGKFPLKAGGHTTSGKSRTTWAAYNPYLHSSNLVFNDQFAGAYDRPNLVVVECRVPVSELTSGYHADQAKDPVGWLSWKSGSVANALKKKGIERKVMLSRWMKPVRELSNAEVAQIYKDTLDGTGIVVPWNVVSPPLREELEKLGVDIDYGYSKQVKASFKDKFPDAKRSFALNVNAAENVKKRDFTYETLIKKKDIAIFRGDDFGLKKLGTNRPKAADIVNTTIENVEIYNKRKRRQYSKPALYNKDLGAPIMITPKGARHGLEDLRNINAEAYINLPAYLENAIVFNTADPEAKNAELTYVLFGAFINEHGNIKVARITVSHYNNSYNIDHITDALYAIRSKKGEADVNTSEGNGITPFFRASPKISIPDLMNRIKDVYPNQLSRDVLDHFGLVRDEKKNDIRNLHYSIEINSDDEQLTEAQSSYFANSKVRDADGRLLKVYHGTNADFTEFDRSFIGAHGAFEGAGFNFTPSETRAGGYKNIGAGGGRVLAGYLNITKPLSDSGKTMSVRELAALIKKIDPTGDDIISNYARDTRDYGSKSFVDREAMTTAKMLYGYHETDVDLYSELSASGANSDAIIEAFKEMGYDGLIHHYDDGSIKTLIAFDSNQFKLADNQNPTDVADIRYGLEIDEVWDAIMNGTDDFDDVFLDEGGNERKVNYRQESMRSMFPILEDGAAALANEKVSKTLVRKIASDLRSMYGSTYNLNTFADNLQKIFAYIQQNGVANYEDLLRVLTEVAQPVIDEAQVVVGSREDYDTFRSNLKRYRIKLNAEQKAEVKSAFDTVQNYRNAFGSNAVFRDDGIALDDIWSELCDMSMGMLDYDTSSADQPLALLDAFEALKPTAKNDYGGSNQDMAYDLALQIIERYFEAHHMQELKEKVKAENAKYRKKVQEKYNERLKKYKQQVRDRANERVQGVRQKANDRIAELKARHRASVLEAKNRRLAAGERAKVRAEAKLLSDMILKPSEKTLKYVPDTLKKPIIEFLNTIDFATVRSDNLEAQRGYPSQETAQWRARLQALVNVLSQIQNGTSGDESVNAFANVLDPDLANVMQKWIDDHQGETKLSGLDYNGLYELKQILRSVRFAVQNANKNFVNERYQNVDDLARATMMDLYKREDQKARGQVGSMIYKLRSVEMLDAFSYFEEMGDAAASVLGGIREGFNIRARDMKQAQEFGRGLLGKTDVSKWTGNKAELKTFQAVEGEIKLVPAQIMSLYCLSQRPQAYNHIMKGGIKANSVKVKGKWTTQGRPVHVTAAQLKAITDSLTPEQKRIADAVQQFMSTESSKWGNRVTQAMYGYDKFTEDHYFPIKTDQNTNAANDQNIENASYRAILNMSAAKQLTPNAMNPIIIDDIFDVFTDHIVQMATYDGMAMPIADAMRWFNYKEVVKMGGQNKFQHYDTVQQEISRVLGKEGRKYFLTFILDMNGMSRGSDMSISSALVSNYKGYAIGANLRVVMQQPTAYLRASAVMNPKYLAEALPSIVQAQKLAKEIRDKSMIAWWKSQGYFDTSIGQTEKQIITGISTLRDEIRDKSSAAAGLADDLTWGVLYKAVQLEQRDVFKAEGKPAAGKDFEEACIKRFDYIVDHTQVVDSTLHRTQYMRKPDMLAKMQSAFMAEPSKSWNLLHRAAVKTLKESGWSWRKALQNPESCRHIARAGTSFVMTALLTSAAAAVMDAFRSDDDDEWQQRWLDAFIDNAVDNIDPMNMLPIVKEFSPYFERMMMENWFGREYTIYNSNTRMDIDGLKNAGDAITKLYDYAQGNFGSKSPYGALKSEIKAFSMLTGIPAYGLMREIETVYNNMVVELTGWSKLSAKAPGKYDAIYKAIDKGDGLKDAAAKLLADTEKSTVAASITRHYKEQYLASRDPQLYNRLVAAYVAIGYDKEDAKKKIDKWN